MTENFFFCQILEKEKSKIFFFYVIKILVAFDAENLEKLFPFLKIGWFFFYLFRYKILKKKLNYCISFSFLISKPFSYKC